MQTEPPPIETICEFLVLAACKTQGFAGDWVGLLSRSAPRAVATACTSSRAAAVIFSGFLSRNAFASTRSAPTPRANAPAAMNSAALAAFTPPVGISNALGNGALGDLRHLGLPSFPQ